MRGLAPHLCYCRRRGRRVRLRALRRRLAEPGPRAVPTPPDRYGPGRRRGVRLGLHGRRRRVRRRARRRAAPGVGAGVFIEAVAPEGARPRGLRGRRACVGRGRPGPLLVRRRCGGRAARAGRCV